MKLTLLVGPPGSGKSTLARKIVEEDTSLQGTVYVNQDSQGKEHLFIFQGALIAGHNIAVDRMGFNKVQRDRYLVPAKAAGYETEIVVLHESYDTCLSRCLARKDHETIRDESNARSALALFFGKYERVQDSEADKVTRVWPDRDKQSACIVDLDGTLCNIDHRLHFVRCPEGGKKDWKGFFEGIPGDRVNHWCQDILWAISDGKFHQVVYCSGRSEDYRGTTVEWLKRNELHNLNDRVGISDSLHLYMRPSNDSRSDEIVKQIILDFELKTRFNIAFCIDDRPRVCRMWRENGLTVLQCNDKEF